MNMKSGPVHLPQAKRQVLGPANRRPAFGEISLNLSRQSADNPSVKVRLTGPARVPPDEGYRRI